MPKWDALTELAEALRKMMTGSGSVADEVKSITTSKTDARTFVLTDSPFGRIRVTVERDEAWSDNAPA